MDTSTRTSDEISPPSTLWTAMSGETASLDDRLKWIPGSGIMRSFVTFLEAALLKESHNVVESIPKLVVSPADLPSCNLGDLLRHCSETKVKVFPRFCLLQQRTPGSEILRRFITFFEADLLEESHNVVESMPKLVVSPATLTLRSLGDLLRHGSETKVKAFLRVCLQELLSSSGTGSENLGDLLWPCKSSGVVRLNARACRSVSSRGTLASLRDQRRCGWRTQRGMGWSVGESDGNERTRDLESELALEGLGDLISARPSSVPPLDRSSSSVWLQKEERGVMWGEERKGERASTAPEDVNLAGGYGSLLLSGHWLCPVNRGRDVERASVGECYWRQIVDRPMQFEPSQNVNFFSIISSFLSAEKTAPFFN